MASYLKILQLFVTRRGTSIDKVSSAFHPAALATTATASTTFEDMPLGTVGISNSNTGDGFLLQTKYGLHLSVHNGKLSFDILDADRSSRSLSPEGLNHSPLTLRVLPSFQTNHLWYVGVDNHYDVPIETMESACPALAPYWDAWSDAWNDAFTAQECDLGSGKEVFADVKDEITWEIEGLLMVCWMVLSGATQKVQYELSKQLYMVQQQELSELVEGFLNERA